jgi:hypothetical protein
MTKYTPLEQWIAQALSEPDRESTCTAMALMYIKQGGGNREVKTINLKGKSHDAKELAKTFQGLAEQYAQDFGGIQQFEMQAFYGSTSPGLHHTITVMDGELQQGGRGRTIKEAPDGPGLVAQAMRHTENTMQMLVSLIQTGAVTSLQRENAMAEREARLRDEVNDAYGIVREMMMAKANENHEQKMRELAFKQSATERKALVGMVPALVNTVSGREIFPQSTSDTALIDALAEEVNPELIQQLATMGAISPKLLGPLMARFEESLRKKKMEEEETKRLVPSSDDPRNDASGGPIQ